MVLNTWLERPFRSTGPFFLFIFTAVCCVQAVPITWVGACRRVAKSTGASVVTTLADMDGQESFDASSLGQADEVIVTDQVSPSTALPCGFNHLHLSGCCGAADDASMLWRLSVMLFDREDSGAQLAAGL